LLKGIEKSSAPYRTSIGESIPHTSHNDGIQINIKMENETVAFYPTTDKFVWRSQTFAGGVEMLHEFASKFRELFIQLQGSLSRLSGTSI
jgi:hypothetical protein